MTAGSYTLELEQGADFELEVTLFQDDAVTPLDLTGASAVAQVRRHFADGTPDLTLTVALSATPTDGRLTITETKENINALDLDGFTSDGQVTDTDFGDWDLFVTLATPTVKTIKPLYGSVTLSRRVTQP